MSTMATMLEQVASRLSDLYDESSVPRSIYVAIIALTVFGLARYIWPSGQEQDHRHPPARTIGAASETWLSRSRARLRYVSNGFPMVLEAYKKVSWRAFAN